MKKAIILLFLTWLCSASLFAQKVDIYWGPEIKVPNKTFVDQIIGKYGDNFFVLRVKAAHKQPLH